jgi:DNA end-binding protein Ku
VARPIWRGSINFGLVTVPVELFGATGDHTIHFRQFEEGTTDRIRYRRVNERTGKEVDYARIVSGYELGNGEYVLLDREELDAVAPGRSRTIDIEAFVDLGEIDPVYFGTTYYLLPQKEEFARSYDLLRQAVAKTNRAGVATFVMRRKEHLAALRAGEHVLMLDTLLFAADVRDPVTALPQLPAPAEVTGRELDMAVNLIESMSQAWAPQEYHDTYTERLEQLIADKRAGREVTEESAPAEPTNVVDLYEALSRSVQKRGGAAGEPAEMTKSELQERARALGVRGRSKMSRAELEKALHEASAGTEAAAS